MNHWPQLARPHRALALPDRSRGPLRVAVIGEGTYPVVKGGVSTWYDQLITGLAEVDFSIVTLVGAGWDQVWDLPANVTDVTFVPMWDPPPRAPWLGRRKEDRRVQRLLTDLWRAALPAGESSEKQLRGAARALRRLSVRTGHPLAASLARDGSASAISAAWNRRRAVETHLPAITLSEAAEVARLTDRFLAVLDSDWPEVDLVHASTNGPASLLAMARQWRDGTPFILSEHGVYLRERYLALADTDSSWVVRAAVGAFVRLICQVAYSEATILAPVNEFNGRWARRLGADPAKVTVLHNGADTSAYTIIPTEPEVPTVSFVGRIDPLKDLHNLIEAMSHVCAELPDARLRIFGPVPEQNHAYLAGLLELVDELGLGGSVRFEGSVPNARVAAQAGHVVALSSVSEGLPFSVIEAMMCGRATVSTDVGGVGEITGRDGVAALLVPPRDPQAFAEALLRLLTDAQERRRMGAEASERARSMFSLGLFHSRVRMLYESCVPWVSLEDPDAVARSAAPMPHWPPGAAMTQAGAAAPHAAHSAVRSIRSHGREHDLELAQRQGV